MGSLHHRSMRIGFACFSIAVLVPFAAMALDVVRYLHPGPQLANCWPTLTADSWFNRHLHRDDYQLAIRHAEQCLEKSPESAPCWKAKATALARVGSYESARQAYDTYLSLRSLDDQLTAIIAARRAGHAARALEQMERALREDYVILGLKRDADFEAWRNRYWAEFWALP